MALRAPLYGLSLCSGVGGIELGLSLALGRGYRTVGYVERDAYAASVLVARMGEASLDQAPIWDDLTTFDGTSWRGVVDLVAAGAPCQPFSTASRGKRVACDLFPEVLRVVRECEPWLVFVENVVGSRSRLLFLRDELRGLGYCVPPLAEVSSAAVGAPHDRERLWLLAHAHGEDERLLALHDEMARLPEITSSDWKSEEAFCRVLGMDDGPSSRMDRIRVIGNSVVPQSAALAFKMLVAIACGQ